MNKTSMGGINSQSGSFLNEPSVEDFNVTAKPTSTYQSSVQRDFLESVSKEIRHNPGPGSYLHDQLMKDKMKALSYHVCQRYQMNPFGTSKNRFDY